MNAFKFFETIDLHMLLKIHTYFMWANTKMNTHFFMEDKDKISEDLLCEFRTAKPKPGAGGQ